MKAEKTEWKGSRLKNVKNKTKPKKSIYIKEKHETRETETGIKETQYYIQRKKNPEDEWRFCENEKKSWKSKK